MHRAMLSANDVNESKRLTIASHRSVSPPTLACGVVISIRARVHEFECVWRIRVCSVARNGWQCMARAAVRHQGVEKKCGSIEVAQYYVVEKR